MPAPSHPAQASTPARDERGVVWLLSWAHFLNDGAANYLPGILPALLAALAIPIGYAGAVIGLLVAGQGLQPLTGALSDRIGARNLIVVGLAGSSLGAAAVGWARTPAELLAGLVLIGACNSMFHPPALAKVRRLATDSGERATAIFLVGGEIGRGVWPLLASVVVVVAGLRSLWVLSLAAAATLPFLWWELPPQPRRRSEVRLWDGLRDARGPLGVLVGYSSLRGAMLFGSIAFVPLLWQARGGRLVTGAALITTMLVVGIVGNLGAAVLAQRWGRRRLVIAGTALACLLLAAFLLADGVWLWIMMAAFGIAIFATLPLTVLMGQDLLPHHHSLGSGLALGFSNALGAGVVAALGLLAARWGPLGVLWAIEACGVLSLGLAWWLPA